MTQYVATASGIINEALRHQTIDYASSALLEMVAKSWPAQVTASNLPFSVIRCNEGLAICMFRCLCNHIQRGVLTTRLQCDPKDPTLFGGTERELEQALVEAWNVEQEFVEAVIAQGWPSSDCKKFGLEVFSEFAKGILVNERYREINKIVTCCRQHRLEADEIWKAATERLSPETINGIILAMNKLPDASNSLYSELFRVLSNRKIRDLGRDYQLTATMLAMLSAWNLEHHLLSTPMAPSPIREFFGVYQGLADAVAKVMAMFETMHTLGAMYVCTVNPLTREIHIDVSVTQVLDHTAISHSIRHLAETRLDLVDGTGVSKEFWRSCTFKIVIRRNP